MIAEIAAGVREAGPEAGGLLAVAAYLTVCVQGPRLVRRVRRARAGAR
ncbi:hypothetical protein K1W54_13315 [Micromonospora sp. CPCC 205371]|nr:hypothetical protein [Micromonospora sp. CPCC 205371]